MFDEEEPGKPKNWGWTIGIIIVICLANLTVFIVLRALLDSENEFDEPLIQGESPARCVRELRADLTKFLGLFALSFCFGCWCCFCCLGQCFKWATFCFHPDAREHVARWWSQCMKQKRKVARRVHKKSTNRISFVGRRDRVGATQDDDLEAARTKFSVVSRPRGRSPALRRLEIDEYAPSMRDEVTSTTSDSPTSPTDPLTTALPIEVGGLQARRRSTAWMEIHRPLTLLDGAEVGGRKVGIGQQPPLDPPTAARRRQSIAVTSERTAMETGGSRATMIGVHHVDYFEVPVSLITPTAVAIVDPAFAEDATAVAAAEAEHARFVAEKRRKKRRASSFDEAEIAADHQPHLLGKWQSEKAEHRLADEKRHSNASQVTLTHSPPV
ncbi:hypothetical protein M3Y99_00659000 [Aphelenchoides fujianensis]|nr:hypothetical protein M3Y99_00659000 [Aphelenchoides fujianensis]